MLEEEKTSLPTSEAKSACLPSYTPNPINKNTILTTLTIGEEYDYKEDSFILKVKLLAADISKEWHEFILLDLKKNKEFTVGYNSAYPGYAGGWRLFPKNTYSGFGV